MGSWGRHGWPKKDEGMRLYKERKGAYFLIDAEPNGPTYDGIANVYDGSRPSLGSCSIGRNYTYEKGCKRVQWSELPEVWQKAFRPWLNVAPESVRGFWLVGQQPTLTKETETPNHPGD